MYQAHGDHLSTLMCRTMTHSDDAKWNGKTIDDYARNIEHTHMLPTPQIRIAFCLLTARAPAEFVLRGGKFPTSSTDDDHL